MSVWTVKLTGHEDATQTMAVSGTPSYMSPEQARGKIGALDCYGLIRI